MSCEPLAKSGRLFRLMCERNSRVLASAILHAPVATFSGVPTTAGARSRFECTPIIPYRWSPPAAGAARILVQGQLDAGRAIQEHAPELITVSWLTTRSTGAELATRAVRSKQLVDEINVLERARDDELWQVRASVILDDKGDGCVVEQAARHGWVVDIIRGGLTSGSEVRDHSPGTTLD